MNKEKAYRMLIELTNQKWSSRLIRKYANSKLSRSIIPLYQRHFRINIDDYQVPEDGYRNLHEFFTRDIKVERRPIAIGDEQVISPVDGAIEDYGIIDDKKCIYAKEKPYALEDLLVEQQLVEKYKSGYYLVIYLSPSNYHKIHCPFTGTITLRESHGERSYPVNKWGLQYGKQPLSCNFRVITEISYQENKSYMLGKIGAMFVNTIEVTNAKQSLEKGEEFAYFSFGSTVILLFQADQFHIDHKIYRGKSVRMGESIGCIYSENIMD